MLLATRQLVGSALRPGRLRASAYFAQWLFAHCGNRKFAEIGSQPRAAASVRPLENGATAVTTMGGCGFCSGFGMNPWPISSIACFSILMFQYLPSIL